MRGENINQELIGCSGDEEFNAKPFHFDQLQPQVEGVIKSGPCLIFFKILPMSHIFKRSYGELLVAVHGVIEN